MKVGILLFLILCMWIGLGVLSAATVQAELITIGIEGVVDHVIDGSELIDWDDILEGRVKPGDLITGTYTYETDTADSNPVTYIARYEHSHYPCGISLSVAGLVFRTGRVDIDFVIEMQNGNPEIHDYSLRSGNIWPLCDDTLVHHIYWHLSDDSATALSSIQLLRTPVVLDDWKGNFLHICVKPGRPGTSIIGHVTSAVVIPEPASILLLGLGGLVFTRRRKK